MNKAESAQIENLLVSRGWSESASPETADMVVINTCSVRETAETRVAGRLGWYAALRAARGKEKGAQPFTLVVTGCMAERLLDTFKKKYPAVDYAVGTFQKAQFADIAAAAEQSAFYGLRAGGAFEFASVTDSHRRGESSAYVPVMHGCDNFCSYCIVPYVRGREVSRAPESIFAELDALSADGVKEITLLGQNVNSYKFDDARIGGLDFPALAELILEHLEKTQSSVRWVRFLSSHPKDVPPRLLDLIARAGSGRRLCRHIHLPAQHGATKILRAMNRRSSREDYLALVSAAREKIPEVSFSTDILVGFPGETEDDVAQTIALMREARFEAAYTYYYNPREGTPAANLPNQIPLEIKKERLKRVIDAYLDIARSEMAKRAGSAAEVLVEGVSRDNPGEYVARTEQDGRVVFAAPDSLQDANLAGSFAFVRLTELTGNTFRGILIRGNDD
jgi:tRNA-2-methylthio-N6-dimethylallyladenosine synthase